ncbi:MAG: hypothetical protein V5A88_02895 [Candidatus Thermoplasmatota archaeon]
MKTNLNLGVRAVCFFAVLAIVLLVISIIPTTRTVRGAEGLQDCVCGCADGIQENGLPYWEVEDPSDFTLQVHEDYGRWSVKGADTVIDDTTLWGEIRLPSQELTADPPDGEPRGFIGWIEPTVHFSLPTSGDPGEPQDGDRPWEVRVTFTVWGTDNHEENDTFDYNLGGFCSQYIGSYDQNIIRQPEENNYLDFEIGGTNVKNAKDVSPSAKDMAEPVYDYTMGKLINQDEIELAVDMARTYAEESDEEPAWKIHEDWKAERWEVKYAYKDLGDDDQRIMTFWEQFDYVIPADDDGSPKESVFRVDADGWACPGEGNEWVGGHAVDYTDDEPQWKFTIESTDNLQDRPANSLELQTEIDGDADNVGDIHVNKDPCDECGKYEEGTDLWLEAIPETGYEFSHWEGDYPVGEKWSSEISVTMDENKELTAWFKEVPVKELTIDTSPGGTTDPSPGTHIYNLGEEVSVSATSYYGYEFSHWYGDYPPGEMYSNPITITMDEDKQLEALFSYNGGPMGPMSNEYEASLEKTAYEEPLEEGTVSPELLEVLAEEGIDDIDKDARLLETEKGWWLNAEGEKEYWLYETEEELEIYAVEESRET